MTHQFSIVRVPIENINGRRFAMWSVSTAEIVDRGLMANSSESEWKKALNVLAFRSHTEANGLEPGSHEFRLIFDGPKPRGAKSKTLTREAW